MGQKLINIRIEVDSQTDLELGEWAEREERSKRRHSARLLKKIVALRRANPQALAQLGLVDHVEALVGAH